MPKSKPSRARAKAPSPFSTIEGAVEDFREGRVVILVDDEDRENEGDFAMAAEKVTPESINFMTKEGRGLVCLALTPERVDALGLPMMVQGGQNGSRFGTSFTVSIEAHEGVTTGISAFDRAHTIRTAIRSGARPSDLVTPGHVFPLRARPGGVLRRTGHTEGVVDLARLAGLDSSGVICEILREDGTMARLPDLIKLSKRHKLSLVTIKDLIAYRMRHERLVERVEEGEVSTPYGRFRAVVYLNRTSGRTHLALVLGEMDPELPTLIRVQPANTIRDMVNLLRSDAPDRVRNALDAIRREGRGVLVYLQPDSMGEEPFRPREEKQESPADVDRIGIKRSPISGLREYGIGAQILADLGLRRIRILTNDERRIVALKGYGLELEGRVPVEVEPPLPVPEGAKAERGPSYLQRP
ncbi:MAG: 3,4-dihydroxy-2-butanone-4-phosphate synthase [bacterium]